MNRVLRGTLAIMVVLASVCAQAAVFPWDPTPVDLGQPGGNETYDDIEGDPSNPDVLYTVTFNNSANSSRVYKQQLTRDADGMITGSTYVADIAYTPGEFVKALAVLESDVVYGSAEEYPVPGDTDGGVYRFDFNGNTLTSVADLTGMRTDGGAAFDPEGIAIDRANSYLYVMTDDATDQDVAQYTINPDGSLTYNWIATVHAGEKNARTGSVTADGDLLTVTGEGTTSNVWRVTSDGTVSNLFGEPLTYFGDDGPRDVLLYDDCLYVADENGMLYAYDWNDGSPSATPSDSWNLRDIGIDDDLTVGGLGLTSQGELLVSIRASGGYGCILAFNLPEPSTFLLVSLGALMLMGRRRRRA